MIRDAVTSDLPALTEATLRLQAAHVEAYPHTYRPFDADAAQAHLTELLAQTDTVFRVAEIDGVVAGHVILQIESRPETLFTHARRLGRITQLEVAPAYRRQGIGRLLLEDCERHAHEQGLDTLSLEVWSFNEAAHQFYLASGYDDLGFRMSRTIELSSSEEHG